MNVFLLCNLFLFPTVYHTIKRAFEDKSKDAAKAIEMWKPLDKEKDMAEEQKLKAAQNLTGKLTEAIKKQEEISKIEGKIAELRNDDPEG